MLLSALLCLAMAGCRVTPEDIDYWTGTQKGPGKIVAVLLADKYDDALREYAALALVRMEPRPATQNHDAIDGVSELQAAVRQLAPEERQRLVDRMVPGLLTLMRGETTAQSAEGEEVSALQVRAKDAAFLLLPYASDEKKRELTAAIVDWFVVDFNGRNLAGNYTAEQVIRQLGAPAASRLVNALNARLPQQALVKLAELIRALGDADTKARAATRLVEIEREMESAEFNEWLAGRLREQLRAQMTAQGSTGEVDEARITAAAGLNRENFITLGALPAMRHLNDAHDVQDRLLEMAQVTASEGLTPEQLTERRVKALQALEGGVRAEQQSALLDLALNDQTPTGVRDYAFDRIADSRATGAVPRLWPVFAETEDWRLRWRVGTLILSLGGPEVVQEFFTRLDDPSYAKEELFGYADRLAQMRPPPTDFINTQLASTDWFDRVIALRYWERTAEEADIARVTALVSDTAATQGEHWEEQDTVGKVAEAVATSIRERLERAAAAGGGGAATNDDAPASTDTSEGGAEGSEEGGP